MTILAPGTSLEGFEIVRLLRQGGSGSIYEAIDRSDGSRVALKVPDSSYLGDIPSWERFRREVALAKRLKHPLIASVKQASDDPAQPFLAVEFVEGVDLQDYIREHGPLPVERVVELGILICDALEFIHDEQVIHRDLKPANIMLQPDGRPRLVDFGIAKPLDMKRITWKGLSKTFGTPSYMAPEQVQGGRVTPAADLYALGIILFEALVGHPPFESENAFQVMNWQVTRQPPSPRSLRPEVPEWLDSVILRTLEKKPQHRYPSAAALQEDLRAQRPPEPLPDLSERPAIPRFAWIILGAAVLLVAGIITTAMLLSHH